ncbi:hypothetical protein WJX73_001638 [Symbiochloris irregularis]|uniref:Uncharacterized protein n=1 Tax=Symbiochloris irregularis TaxID=706552 RepID=A0AAW1P5G1_9CHLO
MPDWGWLRWRKSAVDETLPVAIPATHSGEATLQSIATDPQAPTLKLYHRADRQIEFKVVYKRDPSDVNRTYRFSMYVFYPIELEAVQTNFFSHMFQTIRLHTPEVSLSELNSPSGASHSKLPLLQRNSSGLSTEVSLSVSDESAPCERVEELTQQLQLTSCMLRSAIRAAAKAFSVQVQLCKGDAAASQAACNFVAQITCSLDGFEEQISQFQAPDQPPELRTAAQRAHELLLFEAHNTLARLLQEQTGRSQSSGLDSISARQIRAYRSETGSRPPANSLCNRAGATACMCESQDMQVQAQDHLAQGMLLIQSKQEEQGFHHSRMVEADPGHNEQFTRHIKALKRNARSAVTLFHQNKEPTVLRPFLVDLVGASIAGIAMLWQVFGFFAGQRLSHVRLGSSPQGIFAAPYIVVSVVAYMIKDRIKEWGKRYLQPVAQAMGLEFPHRMAKILDQHGQEVGNCHETCSITGTSKLSKAVKEQRQHMRRDDTLIEHAQPEHVLVYRKKQEVRWGALNSEGERQVEGLDDIIRLDLSPFCRNMQPSQEAYYRLKAVEAGKYEVVEVPCARVYQLHLVFHASLCSGRSFKKVASNSQRATVIMDRSGIKRLEMRG